MIVSKLQPMARISVRLDEETRQLIEGLKLRLGWSYSRILREAILLLAAEHGLLDPKEIASRSTPDFNYTDSFANEVVPKRRTAKSTDHRSRRRK